MLDSSAMDTYRFGDSKQFRILLANDAASRERALSLIYGVYLSMGLTRPLESRMLISAYDALPGTTSLLVEKTLPPESENADTDSPGQTKQAAAAVASLTVITDSPLGLPIETLIDCGSLKDLRSNGRQPGQLAKLATVAAMENGNGKKRPGKTEREEILLHLFKVAFLTAMLDGVTDLLIAVSPHQERFFRKVLLFETLKKSPGNGTGELSVPMRLNLETAEQRFQKRYAHRSGDHNLHGFFTSQAEELRGWLSTSRKPLNTSEARMLFAEKTPLLKKVDEATRRLLQENYPGLFDQD
jgi:N-acyl amino acid synthase FeeM